jgi:inner membrane transporter RhtA
VVAVLVSQDRLTGLPLLYAVAAGVLSSIVPYAADLTALRLVPQRLFGVFMSVHPVLAGLAGLVLLGQVLDLHEWTGIGLVVAANVAAIAAVQRPEPPLPPEPDEPPVPPVPLPAGEPQLVASSTSSGTAPVSRTSSSYVVRNTADGCPAAAHTASCRCSHGVDRRGQRRRVAERARRRR